MELTESFAMTPAASVSGLYFAHPEARYFTSAASAATSGGLREPQGHAAPEAERWLQPNLAYDSEEA